MDSNALFHGDHGLKMIFQLVYRSTATGYLTSEELLFMLERSRANNERYQITGLLLYHEGQFLQLLEGDEAAVRERYDVIAPDQRHKWVSLIMTGPNGSRDFPDWSMGFRDLGRHPQPAEGWSTFLDCSNLPADFIASSRYVRNIFLAFRDGATPEGAEN